MTAVIPFLLIIGLTTFLTITKGSESVEDIIEAFCFEVADTVVGGNITTIPEIAQECVSVYQSDLSSLTFNSILRTPLQVQPPLL
jgi:hypothetical protein